MMEDYKKLLTNKVLEKLANFSFTDYLTGCYNSLALELWFHKYNDAKRPFYLVFLDINNFKKVNQELGHQKSNIILQDFADSLKKNFAEAKVFRFGGDEFVILAEDNWQIKEKIEKFEEISLLKFSFGLIVNDDFNYKLEYLLSLAERKMRKSKKKLA